MEVDRVACAGAVVSDDRGRLLMVRRGHPPGQGLWSIPGGRVEPGETSAEAATREVLEETGLEVVIGDLAGVVELAGPAGVRYVVEDFHARVAPDHDPTRLRAGDDAAEARWFSMAELGRLPCVEGLLETLRRWQVVPGQR
jgi:8-oxo-dGTP diphosphatase